ncbi:MAG: phage tail tube protein [Oscillospiraceae bacterium]|nr:phage tail tube protein [Oscillospiraceae bacterium]
MNGTFTEVWVDGVPVAGLSSFNAKVTKQKADIQFCGQMAIDSKTTGTKGTGSIEFHKIYSTFHQDMAALSQGSDPRHTIVGKLADPDAYGAERVALYNCSFDEHTLMDAQVGSPGKVVMPFTFTGAELLDAVEVS